MKKTMKMFAVLFCAALTLGLTGCSKDYEDEIVGTWVLSQMTSTQTISGLTGEYAEYNGTHTEVTTYDEGEGSTLTFKSDGTCIEVDYDAEGSETSTGTWSIQDDVLTLTLVDEEGETVSANVDIVELDGNKMVLARAAIFKDDHSYPGQVANIATSVKLEYRRK